VTKIACVAVVKNEARHIAEWIAYQFVIGFDTVIILDNLSSDDTAAKAQSFSQSQDIRILRSPESGTGYQTSAYFRALASLGSEFDWMAFFDADEFLVFKEDLRLREILSRFSDQAAIGINWAMFGSSGHLSAQPGLTVENFQRRSDATFYPNRHVKSIIRPTGVSGIINGHMFIADTPYIDLAGRQINWASPGITAAPPNYDIAKLHHYFTRSRQEWLAKIARGYPDLEREDAEFEAYDRNEVPDASATRHAPAINAMLREIRGQDIRDQRIERPAGFVSLSADEVAPLADLGAFAKGRNIYSEIYPGANVALGPTAWRHKGTRETRFCGPIFINDGQDPPPAEFPTSVRSPPLTITRLSGVLCLPGQIALANGPGPGEGHSIILAESFNSRWDRRVHHGVERHADGSHAIKNPPRQAQMLTGRYLYCDNQHRGHFGHIMTDVVSLAWAYPILTMLGVRDLHVLVFDAAFPLLRDFLVGAGIPADRLVSFETATIVEELFVATKCYLTQGYTSPTAIETWRHIRDFWAPAAQAETSPPARIYLSRRQIAARRLVNEDAVIAIFAARGFAIIEPELLTLKEQITLAANAVWLAGPSGSNMFHLAFQRQLRRAMILISPNLIHFSELFLNAGHQTPLTYVLGEALTPDVHASWHIDPQALEESVDAWLAS
jgi:capsular polysaccharide biosynthesis protein